MMDYRVEVWIGEMAPHLTADDLDYILARALKHSDITISAMEILEIVERPSHDKEL